MPQVGAAVSAVIGFFKTVAAFVVTVGGVKLAVGKALLYLATSAAVSALSRALSPKPEFDAGSALDQGATLRLTFDPAYPREVAVGTAALGGSLVYATVSGTNNKYLWRVIALSDSEIDSCTQIWGNGVLLTFSGDLHTGLRACTSHFQSASGGDMLSVRIYKGTSSQTVDPDLNAAAPSEWTSACRGRGVAYAVVRMEYDPDAYPTGEPELFFVLKGALCYDSRTPATAWTENAALIAGQFATGWFNNGVRVVGLGAASADVPAAELEDAADICDENVALLAGGTEDRYRAGGVISGLETARSVLGDLVMAMGGLHIDRGGEIVFLPGVARTPVNCFGRALIDDDFLADEPIVYTPDRPADELCNTIYSSFVDPSAAWREQPLPVRKDTSAITADGQRYSKTRSYRFVTSKTQGQRLNKLALSEARLQGRASLAAGLWAMEYEPGDWETWTSQRFGGATKTFWVEQVELAISNGAMDGQPSARVRLVLVETAATVDDWSTSDESSAATAAVARPTTSLTLSGLGVTAAAVSLGGAVMPELRVTWTALAEPAATVIEFEYRKASDTVIYRASAGPDAVAISLRQGVYPTQTYEVRGRVRAVDRVGAWSSWVTNASPTGSIAAVSSSLADAIVGQGALATSTLTDALVRNDAVGAQLYGDPDFMDSTSHLPDNGATTSNFSRATVASAPVGPYALVCSTADQDWRNSTRKFRINKNRSYEVSLYAKQPTGARLFYAYVKFFDENGVHITGALSGWPASWNDGGYYYFAAAETPSSSWARYSFVFGASGGAVPANAAYANIGILFNYTSGTLGSQQVQSIRCAELTQIGTSLYRADGSVASEAAVVTSLGTAAAITGQGALATQGSVNLNSGEVTNKSLANLDSTANTKLGGIETGADVTASHVAASITGQTSWATSGLSTGRLTRLSDAGDLADLAYVTNRPLSALSGRTADQITYVSGGQTVDSRKPAEANADVTSTHTAASITSQGALATLGAAAWGSQVSGRPTELTDGRVASGLDASGYVSAGLSAQLTKARMIAGVAGTNISPNPEFTGASISGYTVYNNAGGTKLTISAVTDNAAPNGSGTVLRMSYDGTGTENSNPTPGWGGFFPTYIDYAGDGNPTKPGYYRRNTYLLFKIWAKIPTGRTLVATSNATGDGGAFTWLTPVDGTGDWALYAGIRSIGTTGTFSTTGHFYLTGGSNISFTWDVARYDVIDITSAARQFLGRGFADENGVIRYAADLVTSAGVAASVTGQTAWATSAMSVNRLQYVNDSGRITDYRAIPQNAPGGVGASFNTAPITSATSTSITVATCTWTGTGGTISVTGSTISGLSASTKYWVFWDTQTSTNIATATFSTAQSYYSDASRYLALGSWTTPASGSGGSGGGGGGGVLP